MKRILTLVLVWIFLMSSCCFAAEYDLENMNSTELYALRDMIDAELNANHEPSSSQKTEIDKAIKGFVESFYGADNVSWAWVDYSYIREWDFFSMETHADIKKSDGGKAQYDIYGEVVANGSNYQTIYVKVGTEILLDERSSSIHDSRVLSMLGLEAQISEATPIESISEKQPESSTKTDVVIIAQRGVKNETVKPIQEMLIRLGYLSGVADGDFGPGTEKAVKAFQKENGFSEDGIVTQEIYDTMNSVVAAMPVPVEYPKFTAVELYKKFEDNQIAAEAELEGKEIQITGTIEEISETIWGTPYVSLRADSYGFVTIQCYFTSEQVSELAALKAGKKATIQGTCGSMGLLSIDVDDCRLIN